jgi:hypothetical protein
VVVHGQEVGEALNIAAFATVLGMVSNGWFGAAAHCIGQLLCMQACDVHCRRMMH